MYKPKKHNNSTRNSFAASFNVVCLTIPVKVLRYQNAQTCAPTNKENTNQTVFIYPCIDKNDAIFGKRLVD